MPPTSRKPKQFAFILTESEHEMLYELAEAEGRSAANWLRNVIHREHLKRELVKQPASTLAGRFGRELQKGKHALLRPTRRPPGKRTPEKGGK